MRHTKSIVYFIFICALLSFQLASAQKINSKTTKSIFKVLPSFNDGKAKSRIIDFVKNVVNKNSKDYIKPEDRIACFDNDGTMWVEQPLPVQTYFNFDRIRQLAVTHPEWKGTQPFKAVLENDMETISKMQAADIFKILANAESIDNVEKFDTIVNQWLKSSKSTRFQKPYFALVYQPMLEVVEFLKRNGFKIYIVSGGSQEFMRPWMPCIYGIPKEQIIGTTLKTEAVQSGEQIIVKRLPELEHNDDHLGKVISIEKYIGKKPVIVFGNSDGDLEMMQYATTNNPHPTLMVYVNHTDATREYKYDEHTAYGKLVKGMEVAQKNNWLIIDMAKDWKKIFGNSKKFGCSNH